MKQQQMKLSQEGRSYPIAVGSKEKSKSLKSVSAKSGMGRWHYLECGTKVYVLHNGKCLMWVKGQNNENKDQNKNS